MKKPVFTGACTALVTPFLGEAVNYPMLDQLLRRQLEAGIRAVVLCGTTGESATLSDGEKLAIIRRARSFVRERCTIIAGTGSNDTDHAISLSRLAQEAGADALLVVTPYYNKATPEGLVVHYSAVAAAVHIPVIVYNVPSRTGLDVPVEVCRELARIPNIAGIKEASPDISKIARLRAECPPEFAIWSGNDDQAAAVMALGGAGVISVVSNLFPEEVQAMALAALDGDFDTASDLQLKLLPLIRALFREVNPIPVKAAMKRLGYDCGICRLPLTPPSLETVEILKKLLPEDGFGAIVG
ncbi:MAG: 4-hydroxy-tetrahydrodipicolinate synthase [Candidatus Faecousia sp.]|nr:4-hydroxy-tetrahydrodipicolinate synthase [Candidatus Faecousia sp.]